MMLLSFNRCYFEQPSWVKQPFLPLKHCPSLSFIRILGCRSSYSVIYHLRIWLMQQHPLRHILQSPAAHPKTCSLSALSLALSLLWSITLLTHSKMPVGFSRSKGYRSIHFSLLKELFITWFILSHLRGLLNNLVHYWSWCQMSWTWLQGQKTYKSIISHPQSNGQQPLFMLSRAMTYLSSHLLWMSTHIQMTDWMELICSTLSGSLHLQLYCIRH